MQHTPGRTLTLVKMREECVCECVCIQTAQHRELKCNYRTPHVIKTHTVSVLYDQTNDLSMTHTLGVECS